MRIILNNQGWSPVHNGTFVAENVGGGPAYLMRAAAQPAAAVSVVEAISLDAGEDLVDFGIAGNWWGRCKNENSAEVQTVELRVEPYA